MDFDIILCFNFFYGFAKVNFCELLLFGSETFLFQLSLLLLKFVDCKVSMSCVNINIIIEII